MAGRGKHLFSGAAEPRVKRIHSGPELKGAGLGLHLRQAASLSVEGTCLHKVLASPQCGHADGLVGTHTFPDTHSRQAVGWGDGDVALVFTGLPVIP